MTFVKFVKNYIATLLIICILLSVFFLQTKAQTTNSPLQGKSNDVLLIPNNTVNAGEILFKPDTDHDGMTDEVEQRNGTNPNDPADADGDLDGDGLTNGDEVARGTNPNSVDSDGDGISDAEEIRLGYDPLDPNNTPPPNTTIVSLQVSPNPLGLVVNTIFGSTPVQLTVNGITNTGTSVNLTNDANTVYQSLDQSIAAISTTGSVFGVSAGSTAIRVQNGALTATSTANVTTFAPGALSALTIPGEANNVDVAGNYAYIAAGSAGLQIVDVTNRNNPQIVASLDTSGYANDIRINGNFAYIADGNDGLKIINIANPLVPVLSGSVDTPGDAQDVVLYNQRAFIADGIGGLQIVNVNNPATPIIVGAIDTPFMATGVDVSGNYAVVADNGYPSVLKIVNVTNSASPQIVGSIDIPGSALDVVVRGNLAYVAAYTGGIQIIDFSNPTSPVIRGALPYGSPGGFVPQDIEIQGDFAFAADVVFVNAVPIVNIADPTNPTYRGAIDFSQFSDDNGNGIALDSQYVYMTGGNKLFIGRHKFLETDTGGIAPTVNLTSPTNGQNVFEGRGLTLTANANDDVLVAGVQFKVNGTVVGTAFNSPYEFSYQIPLNSTTFSVTATAFDLAGNNATTSPVSVTVTPDSPPTINITAPSEGEVLVQGQNILLKATATDDDAVTRVRFAANGTEVAPVFVSPYETRLTVPTNINSLTIEATATDTVGRTTTAVRTLSVIPDPLTIVTGRVLTTSGQPVPNATVTVFDTFTTQTVADGTFTILNVPTTNGDFSARASASLNNIITANISLPTAPVRGGTTSVGDIRLSAGPTAPTALSAGYFGTRDENIFYGQDLFVSYNDRLSSVYSFNGTDFVPRPAGQMETGAVTAGISSSVARVNTYGDNLTFLQLAGQPGIVDKFNANVRDNITRTNLSSGLTGESEFIGIGRDSATGEDVVAFLSNNETGGAVIKLIVGSEVPVTVPLPSGTALHSLILGDIDNNGFTDIFAVKPLTNGAAKLISIKRSSSQPQQQLIDAGSFETAVESDITERLANPSNGLNNLVIGNFTSDYGLEIAVTGNDRVRIYGANYIFGTFVLKDEIVLPGGEIPTGVYSYTLSNSGLSDILVTTKNAVTPDLHTLFVYSNSYGGGCNNCTFAEKKNAKGVKTSPAQELFNPPTIKTYTISNSNGDSRIFVGNWGGAFNRLDVVVVEGSEVKIFLDLTAPISGS